MSKKAILIFIALLVIASTVFYFYPSILQNKIKNGQYAGTITIGMVPFPGYVALYVARDKEFFKEAGLDVVLKNYASLSDLSRDYTSGVLEGRANLAFEAVQESMQGFDHRVVAIIDHSTGADGILATDDIKSLADLKGKRVAYEKGTLGEYFLSSVLRTASLTTRDVMVVHADAEKAVGMLETGETDAAVTYEPFLSSGLTHPGVRILATSKDAPNTITDVLTFNTSFIEKYPAAVATLVETYFKAREYMKAHPEETVAIVGKEFGISPEEAVTQLQGVTILDHAQNLVELQSGSNAGSLYIHLSDIAQFIFSLNQAPKRINTDTLVDATFVRALK